MDSEDRYERLSRQIASLESVLDDLRDQLRAIKGEAADEPGVNGSRSTSTKGFLLPANGKHQARLETKRRNDIDRGGRAEPQKLPLAIDDYKRYGRQMIIPEIGLPGQLRLKHARVLVIGLGGLGCPAVMYLAGAGVGTMGLMDGDSVELSNLHRQLLHTTDRIGTNKAASAAIGLQAINPSLTYRPFSHHVTSSSLSDIEYNYDLLLDCTDNPASRYLISDLAVAAGIPLISASAMKTDGQLLILNNPPIHEPPTDHQSRIEDSGFCYRCVFPRPPPAETVLSCGESGILGPVVGVMGTLMAVESIKLLSKEHREWKLGDEGKRMLLYSAWGDPPFRTVILKGKRAGCETCSHPRGKIRADFHRGNIDYVQFCGSKVQEEDHEIPRMSASEYHNIPLQNKICLIDVRSQTEWDIAHSPDSVMLPLTDIKQDPAKHLHSLLEMGIKLNRPLVFICRYGNDSREAVRIARRELPHLKTTSAGSNEFELFDIRGGLKAWREQVDPDFPEY